MTAGNNKKTVWAKLSVFSNLLLVVFKISVYFYSGAVSILSEAIHSAIDLIAAFIAYISVKKSSEPPDSEHPFGHGKFENLSGFIESLLIIAAAVYIMYETIPKFYSGHEIEYLDAGMLVMAISAVVNFFVSRKLKSVADETDSIAIETDAAHLSIDVYTSLGVFAGLLIIRFTGLMILDPVISVLIAVYILYLGYTLTQKSAKDLLDTRLSDDDNRKIEGIISEHIGKMVSFHKLATRKSGSDKMIEVHLQFTPEVSLKQAHEIAHHIEDDITGLINSSRVTIHIEPCEEVCKNCESSECSSRKNHKP
ncbi:MAG: cation diffusion facilitator family transporter [Deltaproteobacteria bacterium]|nr:cation diffusion facilitator family transporter [Deltaproteobacteria bacterium]